MTRVAAKRPGSAPGIEPHELSQLGGSGQPVPVTCVDYSPSQAEIHVIEDIPEFLEKHRPEWSAVRWVRIEALTNLEIIRAFAEKYQLHPLAIEDLLHFGQRPKVEDYPAFEEHPGRLFIVAHSVASEAGRLRVEQVSCFLGRRTLVTFQERTLECVAPILHRIESKDSRLRRNDVSFLLYSLLDNLVDQYFPVLEEVSARLEELEESVLRGRNDGVLQEIHRTKRDLTLLRRTAWPMRELINNLCRDGHERLSQTTQTYMRDVYDNLIQILDLIETLRDMVNSLTDTYLSTVSKRLNDIMKTLTIISTIFVPLTFLAGVYGMNMPIPENESTWSYPIFWVFSIVVAGIMLYLFRRRGWF